MLDEKAILPLSTYLEGEYDIDGVCLGVPCVVGEGGIKQVLEIPLDESERGKLLASAKKIKAIASSLDEIKTYIR
jgi:L-lactate dehydrogenase